MAKSAEKDQTNRPVYFLDLSVENVRCFGEKQTLDLSNGEGKPARWTVLLGDNGTGKTTLLKCLVSLEPSQFKERSTSGNQTDSEVSEMNNVYRFTPSGYFSNNKFLLLSGKWGGREFVSKKDNTKNYTIGTQNFYLSPFISNSKENIYTKGYEFSETWATRTHKLLIENFVAYAYGASRRMGSGSLNDTQNSDAAASLFNNSVDLIDAEEWFLQAYFAANNAEGKVQEFAQGRFDKVKKMLLDLLPDVSDIRIKPITKTQLKAAIEVQTPYGWVGMKDLSLGYQSVLAWTVDVASRLLDRYPDSDNPMAEPAIVLVDEIDLHLHPQWQRTLVQKLTNLFPNTQFIVTAHSPLIVQSVPDANIVLLKREGDQVKIYNNQEKDAIRGWRVDQILTSDLFDLPSARPSEYDPYLKRREEILAKKRLSAKDKEELEAIGQKLDELPLVSESKEESEAMDIIRKAAQLLKSKV